MRAQRAGQAFCLRVYRTRRQNDYGQLDELIENAGAIMPHRIFQFDATGEDGGVVRTDWIMTTTGVDTPQKDVDSRVTLGVFTFDSELKDQLMLQGVAFYPDENATLKASSSTVRAIIGGTGKFSSASGWVESFHLDDGSWRHVFHVEQGTNTLPHRAQHWPGRATKANVSLETGVHTGNVG
jgi:hypothetical protein